MTKARLGDINDKLPVESGDMFRDGTDSDRIAFRFGNEVFWLVNAGHTLKRSPSAWEGFEHAAVRLPAGTRVILEQE